MIPFVVEQEELAFLPTANFFLYLKEMNHQELNENLLDKE